MPTYEQTFPYRTSDGATYGNPQLRVTYEDGSVSVTLPPTTPDDCGSVLWQESQAVVGNWDWSYREQPVNVQLAAEKQFALTRLDDWWDAQGLRGIEVRPGLRLKSGDVHASQLQVYLVSLHPGTDATVADVTNFPATIAAADVPQLVTVYETEFMSRRSAFFAARVAIENATTVEQLQALPGLPLP